MSLVDWSGLGRRIARLALLWTAVAGLGLAVTAAVAGAATADHALRWTGIGVVGLAVSAVATVGVSALRGMIRAGDRGERLAGRDVGLSPPQVRRRASSGRSRDEGAT